MGTDIWNGEHVHLLEWPSQNWDVKETSIFFIPAYKLSKTVILQKRDGSHHYIFIYLPTGYLLCAPKKSLFHYNDHEEFAEQYQELTYSLVLGSDEIMIEPSWGELLVSVKQRKIMCSVNTEMVKRNLSVTSGGDGTLSDHLSDESIEYCTISVRDCAIFTEYRYNFLNYLLLYEIIYF